MMTIDAQMLIFSKSTTILSFSLILRFMLEDTHEEFGGQHYVLAIIVSCPDIWPYSIKTLL